MRPAPVYACLHAMGPVRVADRHVAALAAQRAVDVLAVVLRHVEAHVLRLAANLVQGIVEGLALVVVAEAVLDVVMDVVVVLRRVRVDVLDVVVAVITVRVLAVLIARLVVVGVLACSNGALWLQKP